MFIEILITFGIVSATIYMLLKNIKKKALGKCDSCSEGKDDDPPLHKIFK